MPTTVNENLRVIQAIELRKGKRWKPDIWFKHFYKSVRAGADYGVSRNRDLNELESLLAKAIMNGLHYYRDAQAPASTTDGDESEPREADDPPREPAPLAQTEVPRPADLLQDQGVQEINCHRHHLWQRKVRE